MGFVTVGSVEQAPPAGELVRVEANGTPIAVANVGGHFYAFDDTCTHAQCSLAEGELEDTEVVCPCHGGTFDVTTGKVLAAPPTQPVATYAVRLQDSELQIEV